ncbi:MAG: hypothetical protein V1843_03360 [bacterium]
MDMVNNIDVNELLKDIENIGVKKIGTEVVEKDESISTSQVKKPCIFDVSEPCNISNQVLDVCKKCPIGQLFTVQAVFKKVIGLAINMFNAENKLQNILSSFLRKN